MTAHKKFQVDCLEKNIMDREVNDGLMKIYTGSKIPR